MEANRACAEGRGTLPQRLTTWRVWTARQAAFPGVWTNWQSVRPEGGFDAVIGNPPWDRMKLQQVEWFATRRRERSRSHRVRPTASA